MKFKPVRQKMQLAVVIRDCSDVISKYFTVIKPFHEWKRGQIITRYNLSDFDMR